MCIAGRRLSSLDGWYWITFDECGLLTPHFSSLSSLSLSYGHLGITIDEY
jgi:hypothetical protein